MVGGQRDAAEPIERYSAMTELRDKHDRLNNWLNRVELEKIVLRQEEKKLKYD